MGIREFCGLIRGWMKVSIKVFCSDLAMWREWRMSGLLREYVWDIAGSHSVGRLWKRCLTL